jgi:hypothetical protein
MLLYKKKCVPCRGDIPPFNREQLPKDWFAAFQKAGGKGQFISLPAFKEDGHSIFRGDLNAWKNDFEKFIKEIGF